jgi:outer membrane protein OmpA-like peptidoglycan-associated protein
MKTNLILCLAMMVCSAAKAEFVLQLPLGAKETYSRVETLMSPLVAVSPYVDGGIQTATAPTHIRRSVWAFGGEQTLAEVQTGILAQLNISDYESLFFCQTEDCGGFDFRFAIDVVAEPDMRVDLRDFRFISARQTVSQQPSYVTFLLSKSPETVYVQMTEYRADPTQQQQVKETTSPESVVLQPDDGQDALIVLEGLEFESGSATLGSDPKNALKNLAAVMEQDPLLKVLLVGHSDMSGSLHGNIALSTKRASTIRDILIQKFGIAEERLSAHGVGYLSPRASNETAAGKQKNRRVEAVFSR